MKSRLSMVAVCVMSLASACTDAPVPTLAPSDRAASFNHGSSEKYVALGTSISMGWQSDGVYYAGELSQKAVAHELEDMAMVAGNLGFE